jgi:hypothetical protein
MLREVATVVMILIAVALLIGAAILVVDVPCPKDATQPCLDQPEKP